MGRTRRPPPGRCQRVRASAGFVDEGRLAFFFGAIAQLNTAQIRFAFSLDSTEVERRIDAGRRLYAVFERLWAGRALEQRVFVRPSYDPVLLAVRVGCARRHSDPIPRHARVLDRDLRRHASADRQRTGGRKPRQRRRGISRPDFPWICQNRCSKPIDPASSSFHDGAVRGATCGGHYQRLLRDAADAVRGAGAFPALAATLESAGVSELAVYAAAMAVPACSRRLKTRAARLRGLAQYQGAIALITRAATERQHHSGCCHETVRLALRDPPQRARRLRRTACRVAEHVADAGGTAARQDTTGAVADGSAEELYETASGPMEEHALRVLTGPPSPTARLLDWEGTRYRVDFPRADAIRITRAQGPAARPYLSSASVVLGIADVLGGPGLTRETLQQQAQAFSRIFAAGTG